MPDSNNTLSHGCSYESYAIYSVEVSLLSGSGDGNNIKSTR